MHPHFLREAAPAEFKHRLLPFVPLLPFPTRNPAQGKLCTSSNWARLSDPHTHSSCLSLCLGHQAVAKHLFQVARQMLQSSIPRGSPWKYMAQITTNRSFLCISFSVLHSYFSQLDTSITTVLFFSSSPNPTPDQVEAWRYFWFPEGFSQINI